ncbi:Alg9-like mannosyltransferase family [Striga hermonthica]|uniref:Mannosyltransferase n=1 Tax=Striga hermonthica TaxID=68872 RepID=A0A9N7RI30_STRHE|nr:Alg9-like mannosyltransferase family [Striga hermonthica]
MRQRRNHVIPLPAGVDDVEKLNLHTNNSHPSLSTIFIFCLVTRIINSLLVQTYFNPDEHWQAPEVAHRIAFGYGHLTWEWNKGIRSYLHPVIFAALYKVLALSHLDNSWFMIRAPRLLQSVFSAIGDLYLYKYSKALFVIPIGGLVLGFTLLLDCQLYGSWVMVPLNFVKFNFLSSGGDYYGTHAWHWYITQGFTIMLFTYIPFSIAGIIMSKEWKLSGLIIWVLGVYSLLGHKEFRFVLPVLPIALIFSGIPLANLHQRKMSKRKQIRNSRKNHYSRLHMSVIFLLVTNLPMALYMSMVHQRGAEDVMNYLSKEARDNKVKSILFLTPCHATPYYSTLHQNISMRFLDCTPSEERGNLDESDQFLQDPLAFVKTLARNWTPPSHIVLFDSQEKPLKDFLVSHKFDEMKRFFHAHFKVDRELQGSIVVYKSREQ